MLAFIHGDDVVPYEMGDTDGTGIISYGLAQYIKERIILQIANHLITINDDDHASFAAALRMKIVMTAVIVDKLLSQQD